MTASASPKLVAYAALSGAGLLAALVFERPEFVALASPFALLMVAGLGLAKVPGIAGSLTLERERMLEEEPVDLNLGLASPGRVARLDVLVPLPEGLALVEGHNPVAIRMDGESALRLRLKARHWGGHRVGPVVVRAYGPFDMVWFEGRLDTLALVRTYPRPETVRTLVEPRQTQAFSGNRVARQTGDGIEFADLRPFEGGDQIRRVNWRASARSGELWVNEFHTEKNADVILYLDSFAELRNRGRTSLDPAVRAAATIAERCLRHRDRVGFISYGGALRWLMPQMGAGARYRILDALIETQVVFSYVWSEVDLLPRRLLPPNALVLALTPLLEERSERSLLDLKARGFDLAIIEIDPIPYVDPPAGAGEEAAYRLWVMLRDARRGRFRRLGVPVAVWDHERELEEVLQEVNAFRRSARRQLV